MAKLGPAVQKAYDYFVKHNDATVSEVIENTGSSRASTFKAKKEFLSATEKKDDKKEIKARPKKDDLPKRKVGEVVKDEIPESLRRLPRLTLEGFAAKLTGKYIPGEVVYANRTYVGVCPCCTKKVNLFKKMVDLNVSYSGVCKHCEIKCTISSE